MPNIAAKTIPINIEPGIFKIIKTTVNKRPNIVIHTKGFSKEPIDTKVALLPTIMPLFCNPKKAINKPIPDDIANFKSAGIELIIFSLSLSKVININKTEATKTLAKAVCHLTCIPIHTV